MKDSMKKVGKTLGSITCIIAGFAIAYFGIHNLIPKKQYSKADISED